MTLDWLDVACWLVSATGFVVAAYVKGRADEARCLRRRLDACSLANALQLAMLRRQVAPWIGVEVRQ